MPTRTTMPPRMSGSTRAASVDPAAGALADRPAEALGRGLVELDRARDLDRQHAVLLVPQPLELVADAEDHRHPVVLDQQVEEVQQALVGVRQQPVERAPASRWSRSTARRRTPPGRGSRPARRRAAPSCSRSTSSLPCSRATSNSDRAYTWASSSISCSGAEEMPGEVELAERLLDEAPLVGVVERLARDLLGGHDRQVGDLPADVVERAARWPPRCRARRAWQPRPAAPGRARWPRARASRRSGARAATISSACARASFRRSRYSARISSASSRVRSAVSIESSIAFWRRSSASLMRGKARLREQEHRRPRRRAASRSSGRPRA